MKKILFLTNLSTPYRVDFFNELGKMTDLTVVFEAKRAKELTYNWNDDSISNFKAVFLNEDFLDEKRLDFSILNYLKKGKYDAIIVGCYYTRTEMLAILYMRLMRIPYYFETDGGMIKRDEPWLTKKIKNFFIGGAAGYFSPSKGSDLYLQYYGASEKINRYPFTSLKKDDILNEPVSKYEKGCLKEKLGVIEGKIVLAVGQFIHRKAFDILLEACALIDKKTGIYIVGGIPTDEYLEIQKRLDLYNVHFVGFKTKKELEEWFKAADVFVLPTREDIWGLVINEAMAYGLPVITTDKCVAGVELINDKECIIPVESVEALARIVNNILLDEEYAHKLGLNSIKNITNNTFENMAIAHIHNI